MIKMVDDTTPSQPTIPTNIKIQLQRHQARSLNLITLYVFGRRQHSHHYRDSEL